MNDAPAQRTIRRPVALSGIGLHTGAPSQVICLPAPVDAGIVFVRRDLVAAPEVKADLAAVVDTQRGVTLGPHPFIRTVEHLLAASAGLGISNLRVEMRGEELPILDGSAAPYADALLAAGVEEQGAPWPLRTLDAPIWVASGESWVLALPALGFRATYIVPLARSRLGTQVVDFDPGRQRFLDAVAPARTWGFADELEHLRSQGLALGASTENALSIGEDGYISTPRFPDEPARHKVLDLIGDLALLGRPVRAHLVACGAGHGLHLALANRMAEEASQP